MVHKPCHARSECNQKRKHMHRAATSFCPWVRRLASPSIVANQDNELQMGINEPVEKQICTRPRNEGGHFGLAKKSTKKQQKHNETKKHLDEKHKGIISFPTFLSPLESLPKDTVRIMEERLAYHESYCTSVLDLALLLHRDCGCWRENCRIGFFIPRSRVCVVVHVQ